MIANGVGPAKNGAKRGVTKMTQDVEMTEAMILVRRQLTTYH